MCLQFGESIKFYVPLVVNQGTHTNIYKYNIVMLHCGLGILLKQRACYVLSGLAILL